MIVPPSPTSELAEGSSDDAILEVAEVQQEGTFKEAFDAARAQVGPGGIFEWRGQWYNTYTAEEWTGMAPAGKEDYAMLVKPFLENGHNNFHESLHHDVLSGQDTHVEVAHLDTHSPAHSLEGQVDNMLQTPIDNGLDTLDNLFLNT
ncbi:MAG: hypothetical protein R2822_27205 [Spirosomataceae bacterium]